MDQFVIIRDSLAVSARQLLDTLLEFYLAAKNYANGMWYWCLEKANLLLIFLADKHQAFINEHSNLNQLADLDHKSSVSFALFFCVFLALVAVGTKASRKIRNKSKTEISFEDVANAAAYDAGNERELSKPQDYNSPDVVSERSARDPKNALRQDFDVENDKGFKFYKKRSRDADLPLVNNSFEDDEFLLSIEQEMLATRQLYLDGLISKEVYVSETRILFVKAQNRMT